MVARPDSALLLAPREVWDRGRERLAPFAPRFAEGTALLLLIGRPREADLSQALDLGLASVLGAGRRLYDRETAIVASGAPSRSSAARARRVSSQ